MSTEIQICLKIQEDVIGCTVEVKIVLVSITREHFHSFYYQKYLVMFAHKKAFLLHLDHHAHL